MLGIPPSEGGKENVTCAAASTGKTRRDPRDVRRFAIKSPASPLDFFRDIGLTILDRWRRADFDARAFPDVASGALHDRPPSAHVDAMDVVRWVHDAPLLVPQTDIAATFGQPPVNVFHCERFYIQVLFWLDGTTAIHQHAFSGAFHVMQGSSLESTYSFL